MWRTLTFLIPFLPLFPPRSMTGGGDCGEGRHSQGGGFPWSRLPRKHSPNITRSV